MTTEATRHQSSKDAIMNTKSWICQTASTARGCSQRRGVRGIEPGSCDYLNIKRRQQKRSIVRLSVRCAPHGRVVGVWANGAPACRTGTVHRAHIPLVYTCVSRNL